MSTHYRNTSFLQIAGTTEITFAGAPTARTSIVATAAQDFASEPWKIGANGRFTVEIDATNRGGGILAIDPIIIQRSIIPMAAEFPAQAGVVWNTVPAADISPALVAVGGQNIQQVTVTGMAGYVYRVFADGTDVTSTGDIWIAVLVPSRFSK